MGMRLLNVFHRHDGAEQALVEKVERQKRLIAELQSDLAMARATSTAQMLKQLRLHEAVLLYVGKNPDRFIRNLAENFDVELARAVSESLFVLDNAPVAEEVRKAFESAIDRGLNRW